MNCFVDKDKVLLDATCATNDKSRLFSIKKAISSKDDVITGMNKAFSTLEKELIDDLIKGTSNAIKLRVFKRKI